MKHNHLAERANRAAEENQAAVNEDPYRLSFHIQPPSGLLNDPNGLVYFKGQYHVFYQWNPYETNHGAKYWAHMASPDLVNWEELPIALTPSEPYEKNGCYSGSAIVNDGRLYLFYTGNVKNEAGERETYQCMAVSEDGIHFEKKGPVINLPEEYTAHFRDPKVWKKEDKWYMVLGAQTLEKKGAAVLFSSRDLENWKHIGKIAGSGMNGLGDFGYMWECPDLFPLDGKEILLISPQGLKPEGFQYQNLFQSGYFIGQLDEKKESFAHGAFAELDRGFDFYAPQTMHDHKGRRILFAWMGMTDEQEPYQPTVSYHWIHALTLPRELHVKGGKLIQTPVEELRALRRNEMKKEVRIEAEKATLSDAACVRAEILLEDIRLDGNSLTISLREHAFLKFNVTEGTLQVERPDFKDGQPETRSCLLEKLEKLHLFLDTSSAEIFVNGGEEVFTLRYFPSPENEAISFEADGGASFHLRKWELGT
ncbi:sucrose-6-phosphate hydrolase [Metabacillus sp. GX 13764]|nr:sucrose-6-phosphate hydrolase [Metabacillus kandeliae]MCD7036456.1 sucrose-6-phosphate hydrolase [Metabacillus kandeliae]